MINDQRRPPFCFQTHNALDLIREHFSGSKLTTALAVYLVLTEFANRVGGASARQNFRAGRKPIAEAAGISVDTLDRYAAVFVEAGLLAITRERVDGASLPNRWSLLDGIGATPSRTDAVGVAAPQRHKGLEETQEPSTPDGVEEVRLAWKEHAPPLTEHRDAYLTAPKAATAIRGALKIYPADAVVAAIELYATCLGSDDYRWSYRWTLIDFLKRGLDRFVPEAKPLERERVRSARDAHRSLDHIAEI